MLALTDVETIISNIIAIPIDDGVSFYIKRISEIMEKADYPGVRVSMETKFDGVTTPLSSYRPINHSLQKLEAFQSVLHVVFILCYTVLQDFLCLRCRFGRHRADVHWTSCALIFSLIRVRKNLWEDITQGKVHLPQTQCFQWLVRNLVTKYNSY